MNYLCFGIPQKTKQVVTFEPENWNARQIPALFEDATGRHSIKFVVKKMSDERERLIEIFAIDSSRIFWSI